MIFSTIDSPNVGGMAFAIQRHYKTGEWLGLTKVEGETAQHHGHSERRRYASSPFCK